MSSDNGSISSPGSEKSTSVSHSEESFSDSSSVISDNSEVKRVRSRKRIDEPQVGRTSKRKRTTVTTYTSEAYNDVYTKSGKAVKNIHQRITGKRDSSVEERPNIYAYPSQIDEDDEPCRVCGDGESSDGNQIVYCDGCDIPVHQNCYGIEEIPEGDWLCNRCTISATPDGATSNAFISQYVKPDAQPEMQVFHSSMDFATICSFLYKFGIKALNLEEMTILDIVNALSRPKNNLLISKLHQSLLLRIGKSHVNNETWVRALMNSILNTSHHGTEILDAADRGKKIYDMEGYISLTIPSRIAILNSACNSQFDRNPILIKFLREECNLERLREPPIGYDSEMRTYWLIEDAYNFWISRYSEKEKKWETICWEMEHLNRLIESFSFSSDSNTLHLWYGLANHIKPYLERKIEMKQKAEAQFLRASRRLESSGLDLSAIIFDEGRPSRRCRKQIDYSFREYDNSIKDSIRSVKSDKEVESTKTSSRTELYHPSQHLSRSTRARNRQINIQSPNSSANEESEHLNSNIDDDQQDDDDRINNSSDESLSGGDDSSKESSSAKSTSSLSRKGKTQANELYRNKYPKNVNPVESVQLESSDEQKKKSYRMCSVDNLLNEMASVETSSQESSTTRPNTTLPNSSTSTEVAVDVKRSNTLSIKDLV